MVYKIVAPNATKSPGLFPAEANENWQRLVNIINADHIFAFSVDTQQGMHKQCSLINRATPMGSTAPASGILYSKNDTSGAAQLNWYNGSSNVQVTPGVQTITGSASILNNGEQIVFLKPSPDYSYVAYVWASIVGSAVGNHSAVANHFTTSFNSVIPAQTNAMGTPFGFNVGNDLLFVNRTGGTATIAWSALIIRLS